MLDLMKLVFFCSVVWVMWLAIGIAGTLVGVVLALWVLSFFAKVATYDEEEDEDG